MERIIQVNMAPWQTLSRWAGPSADVYKRQSSGSYYSNAEITSITELLQFALLVNGYDTGAIAVSYTHLDVYKRQGS